MINAQPHRPVIVASSETKRLTRTSERRHKGHAVSAGVGMGRPCFYRQRAVDYQGAQVGGSCVERSSLRAAFAQVQQHLNDLSRKASGALDGRTAEIFEAHSMICAEIETSLLANTDGEEQLVLAQVVKLFDDYALLFNQLADDYFKCRAGDFEELKQLLIDALYHSEAALTCREKSGCVVGECELQNPHIIVAEELTASVVIRIKPITKGIVVDKCGINSHAALIARSLKIPVVSGIEHPASLINTQDTILIDGDSGELIINPEQATCSRYQQRMNTPRKRHDVVAPLQEFEVLADIELCGEVDDALKVQADGIGLYRTEFEVLAKGSLLGLQEQFLKYQSVVHAMAGKPVYFRLFDLGSDKALSFLDLPEEANPALGCRGARLLALRPELLQTQARALAFASREAEIHVLYPMISSVRQFMQLKSLFAEATADIEHTRVRHGVMIEVPSLCENAPALFQVVDFARVGTSDLAQYLYAFDRGGDDFCYEDLVSDPAIWNVLRRLVRVAGRAGKSLGVCGALVDDARFIARLIDVGITHISTHSENIASIRRQAMNSVIRH